MIALVVARSAEHSRDRAVCCLGIEQFLQTVGQQLAARLADVCIANALGSRRTAAAAHLDRIFALPGCQRRFLLAGAVVTKGRAHVAHVKNGLARLTRPRTVVVLFRIETTKLLIVGLGVAMIDEAEPKLEGIDLRARSAVLKQLRERSRDRAGVFAITLHVDAVAQRQLDAGGGLKRREARALKSFVQTLLAVRAGNIGDPLVVREETQRLRETRRKKLAVDLAVLLVARLSFEVRLDLVTNEFTILLDDARNGTIELRRRTASFIRLLVGDANDWRRAPISVNFQRAARGPVVGL